MKNRIIIAALSAALSVCALAGCKDAVKSEQKTDNLSVVATIFPEYDWVSVLSEGTDNEITLLEDSGADLHNFQPTAQDILKIKEADLFVYVGGESDEWVEELLEQDSGIKAVNLLDAMGDMAKEEEHVEGAEEHEEHEEEEGEEELDEHVWLSLKNAKALIDILCDELVEADSKNESTYRANADKYLAELESLDAEYESTVKDGSVLLFGDRFPFRYMADDYNIKCYAAFSGCSAETEASFETVAFLSQKMDECGLGFINVIDGSDKKVAQAIIDNTKDKDAKILTLNSMQSITRSDVENKVTYLGIMKDNLKVLQEELSK